MAKASKKSVLNRMSGKTVCFNGKFDWSEEENLRGMAKAQEATIAKELSASVDYLVLADMSAGKTIQKKAMSLNAKGANIQVIDAAAFETMVKPTQDEVLALIRAGKHHAETLKLAIPYSRGYVYTSSNTPVMTFAAEKFDGLDLSGFELLQIAFNQCSFAGATIDNADFDNAVDCDFRKARGESAEFGDVEGSKFNQAVLPKAEFQGKFSNADFSGANLEEAEFSADDFGYSSKRTTATVGCNFAGAKLRAAQFRGIKFTSPNFDGADLTGIAMNTQSVEAGSFRKANLRDASLVQSSFTGADFTGADLTGANLAGADLTDAKLDGANLSNCNLRGAKLHGVDLSKAKNYDPANAAGGVAGPALKELDSITKKAKKICITMRIGAGNEDEEATIDSNYLKHGWFRIPQSLSMGYSYGGGVFKPSDALLQLSNLMGHKKVRYETVDVQSTKSPAGGKELRDLVLNALVEAFAQPLPPSDELAAATTAYRDKEKAKTAKEKAKRDKEKAKVEKKKEEEKKQIATKIEKEVGKVTDIATFLKALELRADKQKIDKATKMLKASGFQLFNDVTAGYMNGVVKSQTDPDLVYACRLESTGAYACCTQNLNICGGLRGSICKHLLVLIIGLVKAGELDPTAIDSWIAKTHDIKPELNKETMGDIFIRYKGAEAGEVDWRPTETVPEDYYAL